MIDCFLPPEDKLDSGCRPFQAQLRLTIGVILS